ncbi:phosphoribosylamine--glycine ligase [Candidatus Acetothermia bacterium]|nr:phosphoribosylamine--glycine ligase [Candidatus Acetothermia bacterium]MBI3643101.1 phosphoribosylamine--glycine ligase [Candidatus Acetothermia bacterium]
MAKVLVIGSGGREHAIVRSLTDDADVDHVYVAPGNGGTGAMENVTNLPLKDSTDLVAFADREEIGLTVIGPEQPLVEGLADLFHQHELRVFGFKKSAAQLEGSKSFAKDFMKKYAIPTAQFEVFTSFRKGFAYLQAQFNENPHNKFFIKADELCAGKGVISASTLEEGRLALKALLLDKCCGTGGKVVIEEALPGQEASLFALTDGSTVVTLPPAQDHKRALDNDEGLNTGGMGAYAPAKIVGGKVYERIEQEIILPTLMGMEEERISDCGILFFGLMIDPKGKPYVLEYNVRFGDPEAQAVLTLLKSDLYPLLNACATKTLEGSVAKWHKGAAVTVVMAVSGYPTEYNYQGEEIMGISKAEALDDIVLDHAGTEHHDGKFFTKGGRVLGVTARGTDVAAARKQAYKAVSKIKFDGMHYRKDIAAKALE